MIVRTAVFVAFAVGLVVLLVIADKVVEGKTIVRGDEVYAGPGFPSVPVEDVSGGAQTRGHGAGGVLPLPESAYCVAEFVIPFGPAWRKFADLIAARAAIPRFGDQLDSAQHRILAAGFQKATLVVEAIRFARKNSAEIKTETIYLGFLDPITQAVGDHLHYSGVRKVDSVAGARVIDVVARLVGDQAVVTGVVDALEGERGPHLVALGGVVIDHIENHFEPGIVEPRDHLLEFLKSNPWLSGITRIRSKKANGIVAPVVR